MIKAVPLEDDLSALDVYLLDDTLPQLVVLQAADRGEIPGHRAVDRDQRGVLRANEELVVVSVAAVAAAEAGHLAVGMVEDHILVYPVHPGEHALAAIALHFEIVRASVPTLQRTEPHHLPAIVDYQRAALPSVSLLRADEDVAGGCVVRLSGYLDGGWAEVGARAEDPRAVLRSGLRPVGDRPNGLHGLAGLRG